MAFQVLFASTGVAVIEHLCQIKSSKTYTLHKNKNCCLVEKKSNFQHKSQAVLKKTNCCKELAGLKKISTDSVQKVSKNSDKQKIDASQSYTNVAFCVDNLFFIEQEDSIFVSFNYFHSPRPRIFILHNQFLI